LFKKHRQLIFKMTGDGQLCGQLVQIPARFTHPSVT
jgi:hypothetical protein